MAKYLDYKTEVWVRIPIYDDELFEELPELLENNTAETVLNDVSAEKYGNALIMTETQSEIHVNENDGQSTIELVNDEPEYSVIWDNSYESEAKRKLNNDSTN